MADRLRQIFAAFGAARDALSVQAFNCFNRVVLDLRLRRIRFGALGLPTDTEARPSISRVLGWPGAACFPGVARIELPARRGQAQELPIGEVKVGTLVLALPVLDLRRADAGNGNGRIGAVEAIDIVWCDPVEPRHWARATGYATWLGPWPFHRIDPATPVRLHRYPLAWFRACASGASEDGCLLENAGDDADSILLGPPLVCDDAAHAEHVRKLQQRARERARARLPKPGKLFLASAAP